MRLCAGSTVLLFRDETLRDVDDAFDVDGLVHELVVEAVSTQLTGRDAPEALEPDLRDIDRSMIAGLPTNITDTALAVSSWLRRLVGDCPSSLPESQS